MLQITSNGPYIARVVGLEPDRAGDVLDRVRAAAGDRWAVPLGWGALDLGGEGSVPPPRSPSPSWPLRRFFGTLRSAAGWYRIAVELELLPWSDERAELGLRPVGRWPPAFLSPVPYAVHGARAVERLGMAMLDAAVGARIPGRLGCR